MGRPGAWLALPALPSAALKAFLRVAWMRWRCHHVPKADDGYGYVRCQLCGAWIL